MKINEYYIGLDMGVSSVGWAVTDKNYKILRAKGKDLWGIREFEEAKTSAERRTTRVSRRRRQRQVARIGLLRDYFHAEISKVDPYFFQRLDNSKYYLEDKDENVKDKNALFNDPNYTDAEYFKQYPTIFHLRSELIHNTEAHDVRLVYLAIHNLFKRRGHFLNASLSSDEELTMKEAYVKLNNLMIETLGKSFPIDIDSEQITVVLSDLTINRTRKSEKLAELFAVEKKDKDMKEFVKGLCGLKVKASVLFGDGFCFDADAKTDFAFSDFGYEDSADELYDNLGEELSEIVVAMKSIYDIGLLAATLKGEMYLSDARIKDYEKHKADLKILKRAVVKYAPDKFDDLFRSNGSTSYSAYVNSVNAGDTKQRRSFKERSAARDNLYKAIKGIFKGIDDQDVTDIFNAIDTETFLPLQLTRANGIIPNQVHAKELKKILSNAETYLPFLKEKDESGLTVSERIAKVYSFQIPYYIGPVTEKSAKDKGNGWVVRKEAGKVLPWNIEEKIDVKKTSEKFIERMVRRCTYISGETVLPKNSLLYEKFMVLNELNNLKIDGEKIDVELKQKIYIDLFETGKKVARKDILKYLNLHGYDVDDSRISGIDTQINSSLSSYGQMYSVFGDVLKTDSGKEMAENIIFWGTIYGDSKKMFKERVQEKYADAVTDAQMKRILGFKFKDWGNLSKEFLTLSGVEKSTGEVCSLIARMWETNMNMMELINSDEYTYANSLEEYQNIVVKPLSEMKAEDLDEYYFSAPVKRMVWQTLLILEELERVIGHAPEKIFVEVTRKEEEKKRTITRKQKFLDLYKNVKDESRDWQALIEAEDNSGRLRSKKMYLYLTQQGKCMYTGRTIDLDDLFNDNLYDIDHIYPQHYIKDDNIDNNLVLVYKPENSRKSDVYPIDEKIYQEQHTRWKELHDAHFINDEKYKRLIGRNPFTPEQLEGFISRQLVETSQGIKTVTQIIGQALPDTKIVFSKAANVSEFRHKFDIPKSRLVNDFHHAHDAYLNIVVGNCYYTKFTSSAHNFMKEVKKDPEKNKYNLSNMFKWNIKRGEETAWVAAVKGGEPGTIALVKEMLKKNTPLMTRFSFEQSGAISDATIYDKNTAKPGVYLPLKVSDERLADVTKYGGYNKAAAAYMFLVEHDVKGSRVRTIETLPIVWKTFVEKNPNGLEIYCKEVLGLCNPSIRLKKIKYQSLIFVDDFFYYLAGKSEARLILKNAVNMIVDVESYKLISKIEKFKAKGIREEVLNEQVTERIYDNIVEKHINAIFKRRQNSVVGLLSSSETKDKFLSLSLDKRCEALYYLIQLTSIGSSKSDLSLINGTSNSGYMRIGKKINNLQEIILITQSVTGLIENRIDLLTV